ncbi:MAG: glutamine synthetase [Pseudomonadales bacterium]|jgi:glutamine synthetase|nr:glutamine synthetase [Pseudomonadales bacterium]MBP9032514.1 glutamine synthetase [Pseudomonadales bacterium]
MYALDAFLQQHPDLEVFEVLLPDINGQLRGKWVSRENLAKVFGGGFKLPVSTIAFDIWGRDIGATVFEDGDADGVCLPEPATLARVPWLPRATGQVLVSMGTVHASAYAGDPRTVLANVLARYARLGLRPVVAAELEFYLFERERNADGTPRHTQTASGGRALVGGQTYGIEAMQDVGELMHGVREAAAVQGLPVDTLITEAAPSQFEINLFHQDDALRACDQALLLKRAIKGVARAQGRLASFMAKPFGDLAGNGMHIHFSLVDASGRNVFDDDTDQGSELLRHAVAGCLATMPEAMALFAPNVNSYRRLRLGSHAPHAPTWGYENRTAAVRIPGGSRSAIRLEHRVCGADANPYLAVAGILAGALLGIEQRLAPPAPVAGDAYSQYPPGLPRFWPDALRAFEKSAFVGEYLGEELRRVFLMSKWQELEEFLGHVSPLEYDAYLDL